jgi:hypothetical protein
VIAERHIRLPVFVFHELVCLAVVNPLAVDADAHLSAGGRYQDTGMASSAHDSQQDPNGVLLRPASHLQYLGRRNTLRLPISS